MNDLGSDRRYRVAVSSVIPAAARMTWRVQDRCYLGISFGSPSFESAKLAAMLEWIDRHFKQCAIVLGDRIYRHTLRIERDIGESEAEAEAFRLGSEFLAVNKHLLHRSRECQFELFRFADIQAIDACRAHELALRDLYQSEDEFAQSVRNSATAFVERRRRQYDDPASARTRMVASSVEYLLEEMAGFAWLVEAGWPVEVYPGAELPTLAAIAEGEFDRVPEPLKRRMNLALKLKKLKNEG